MPTVDRIRAKITRAKQHIQDFQLAARAFADSNPFEVRFKEDANRGERIFYLAKVDPVPEHLAAIAADVIQNLRSPLDHIAYQLVLAARGCAKPDWDVYYPIAPSAARYPATRKGAIKGVRQEVIDAIDATEPYEGGKGEILWQLNELNKPDKHELLIAAAAFSRGFSHHLDPAILKRIPPSERAAFSGPMCFIRHADPLPAKVGDELYVEPINVEVNKNRQFTFHISFNTPRVAEDESALTRLQEMANRVDDIITQLGSLLP